MAYRWILLTHFVNFITLFYSSQRKNVYIDKADLRGFMVSGSLCTGYEVNNTVQDMDNESWNHRYGIAAFDINSKSMVALARLTLKS